jgi:hypothetical protein
VLPNERRIYGKKGKPEDIGRLKGKDPEKPGR